MERDAAEADVKRLRGELSLAMANQEQVGVQARTEIEHLREQLDDLQLEHDSLQADLRGPAASTSAASGEALTAENARLKGRVADLERLVAAVRAAQPDLRGETPVPATDGMQDIPLDQGQRPRSAAPVRDVDELRAAMVPIQIDLTSWYDKHAGEILVL